VTDEEDQEQIVMNYMYINTSIYKFAFKEHNVHSSKKYSI